MFFQTFEIALDGVPYVRRRFVTSFSLGNAAWQRRTLSDENAIFVRFDCHSKFHAASLANYKAVRNARKPVRSPIVSKDVVDPFDPPLHRFAEKTLSQDIGGELKHSAAFPCFD